MTEMRLQRALARAGVASRRAAEELIEQGKVRVDGAVATLASACWPAPGSPPCGRGAAVAGRGNAALVKPPWRLNTLSR